MAQCNPFERYAEQFCESKAADTMSCSGNPQFLDKHLSDRCANYEPMISPPVLLRFSTSISVITVNLHARVIYAWSVEHIVPTCVDGVAMNLQIVPVIGLSAHV